MNPLQEHAAFSLFSTHPKTSERVAILARMAGVGYAAYEAAYQNVHGRGACIGAAQPLADDQTAPLRSPTPSRRNAPRRLSVPRPSATFSAQCCRWQSFEPAPCGANLKIPANFKRDQVVCPRCGKEHATPRVQTAASGEPAKPLSYIRRGQGWESFQCTCGHLVQLSPGFEASSIKCSKCGQSIAVTTTGARVVMYHGSDPGAQTSVRPGLPGVLSGYYNDEVRCSMTYYGTARGNRIDLESNAPPG